MGFTSGQTLERVLSILPWQVTNERPMIFTVEMGLNKDIFRGCRRVLDVHIEIENALHFVAHCAPEFETTNFP